MKYHIILKILCTLKSTLIKIWNHIGLILFAFWLETQATFLTNKLQFYSRSWLDHLRIRTLQALYLFLS